MEKKVIKFIKSNKKQFYCDNYKYCFNKKNSDTSYYRCSTQHCSSAMVLSSNDDIINDIGKHNHDPCHYCHVEVKLKIESLVEELSKDIG